LVACSASRICARITSSSVSDCGVAGVDRPGFHGAHRHRDSAMTGEENNGHLHLALRQLLLQLQPAQARELDIEHQTAGAIWTLAGQKLVR
jgi:hypothetical protein